MAATHATLELGADLALPLELVSRRTTILGQTGTGKTSTAVVLVEEAARAGAQFVVLDPTGAWWGLSSNAKGTGPGVDCVVMGGRHGDVPIDEHAGREVARLVADEGYSLVLDLDGLKSWSARQRFTADFASELYERAHSQILLVIDEANRVAPQGRLEDNGHAARCLGAVSDAVLLGRRRGLGTLLVCTRAAKLNKDVLEMSEVLIAHRVRGNNDRAQLKGWIEENDLDVKALLAEIAGLPDGMARVSAPTLGVNGTFRIRPKNTFDSSKSIGVGEVEITPRSRAHVDMDALRDRMAAVVERTQAEDPKVLAKRIRDLEAQLAARPDVAPERVEVPTPFMPPELVEQVMDAYRRMPGVEALVDIVTAAHQIVIDFAAGDSVVHDAPEPPKGDTKTAARGAVPPAASGRVLPPASTNGHSDLPPARQRILDTLAWFGVLGIDAPSRAALAPMAGSKPTSGGFKNNLGALRSLSLIDYPVANRVALTADGTAAARTPETPATPEALQVAVLATLPPARQAILRTVIDHYPGPVSRGHLAQCVGVPETSGGFKNNLGALRTLELIDYPAAGQVVARPLLFLED